jgi:uncharacterized protein (DUF2235 family)
MPKNIVICCDGTGNEIKEHISNVLKLFRIARKNDSQYVFYDPGVGTLSQSDKWSEIRYKFKGVLGLATGYGLDDNILKAYTFLIDHYQDGDQIFLFGFSRGAYTVRALAGFMHLIGLLQPHQKNLCGYALAAYKQSTDKNDLAIGWRFQKVTSARQVTVKFVGVWDTVASILVPRSDRLFIPSLQTLPYTRKNPSVQVFRQAMAIDERRRMFRLNRWEDPQKFIANPFKNVSAHPDQDIKQVWFAGVHSDIGGGYPESESGLSKFPLRWMIDEAVNHGLIIDKANFNHMVNGYKRRGSSFNYIAPDVSAKIHDSMTAGWKPLEWLPKSAKLKEWPGRRALFGLYLPNSEPRLIPDDAFIHQSAIAKIKEDKTYTPSNIPKRYHIIDVLQTG